MSSRLCRSSCLRLFIRWSCETRWAVSTLAGGITRGGFSRLWIIQACSVPLPPPPPTPSKLTFPSATVRAVAYRERSYLSRSFPRWQRSLLPLSCLTHPPAMAYSRRFSFGQIMCKYLSELSSTSNKQTVFKQTICFFVFFT